MVGAMPRGRRSRPDPLATRDHPMWMVVYDRCSLPLDMTRLAAFTDLHATLETARQLRIADGWACEEINGNSFFFCAKDGVRVAVHIHQMHPHSSLRSVANEL
jgi:hypothetical protein